jgi:hypothetical protein
MKVSGKIKRIAAAASAVGVLSGAAIAASAGVASASTIPTGEVQICAQGNYAAYIEFPDLNDSTSTVVPQGQCWISPVHSDGWEPIDVYGIWNTHPGQSFYIGTEWYDEAVSGIGIGAEGTSTSPYLWTW